MFERSVKNELVVIAVLVGAAACLSGGGSDKDSGDVYGYRYDSGWSGGGGSDGTTGGSSTVGDGFGAHAVTIQEYGCTLGWGLAGFYTGSGADYKWDVTLTLDSSLTDCPFGEDTAGKIEATGGKVYFGVAAATSYIGAAGYNGTTLSWATIGYVAGGGGYAYAYDGNITW